MKTQKLNKPFSMIREFQLADWFTLANAVCGTGALFSMLTYLQTTDVRHIYFACGMVFVALIFDVLRWTDRPVATEEFCAGRLHRAPSARTWFGQVVIAGFILNPIYWSLRFPGHCCQSHTVPEILILTLPGTTKDRIS